MTTILTDYRFKLFGHEFSATGADIGDATDDCFDKKGNYIQTKKLNKIDALYHAFWDKFQDTFLWGDSNEEQARKYFEKLVKLADFDYVEVYASGSNN